MIARIVPALAAEFVVMALVLFGTAGTWQWPAGWVFLALFVLATTPMSLYLARHDPELAKERMRLFRRDQPWWDRMLMLVLIGLICVWFAIPGLDAVRFATSRVPLGLRCLGAVFMLLSLLGGFAVMCQNTFLAPTVRLQAERSHHVVSTGAYAVVRHPFYAALLPLFPATGLLLGSWWALLFSALIFCLLGYRAIREERFLETALQGYSAYKARVRYRLVPYVW